MSYSILYGKQFIKVDNERVIPFIEVGDNNVYEAYGRGTKRSRDWGNSTSFITENSMIVNANELLSNIDKDREQLIIRGKENAEKYDETWVYDDKRYGWHVGVAIYGYGTTKTTFGMFRSFYKTGIKQALTIEELKERGVTFNLIVYRWRDEDILSKGLEIKPDVKIESTEHLIKIHDEYKAYYGKNASVYLTTNNGLFLSRIKKQTKRETKEKVRKEVEEYYVLESGRGYFVRNMKRGYKYSLYLCSSTKKFITEKEANKFHDKMPNKEHFKVNKIEAHGVFYV